MNSKNPSNRNYRGKYYAYLLSIASPGADVQGKKKSTQSKLTSLCSVSHGTASRLQKTR